jgi:hypothetical protein
MKWDVMVRIDSSPRQDAEGIIQFVNRAFEAQGQGVEILMVLKNPDQTITETT